MLDVSALVHQMHDTLSQIHETITSLDTKNHDDKLDALETQRDSLFEQLQSAFQKQSEELEQRRKAERDEIAEKRRKEDEEIAARRKKEDVELHNRAQSEDSEREKKLEVEKKGVEDETDSKMEEIETEAQRMLDEGHKKISELEQKRREINSLIDEQMKAPLPPPPKRRRGTRSTPAQRAPAEPAQKEEPDASRDTAPQESTSVAEPQAESREIGPETTSAGETNPEKASTEEAVPEKAPQADSNSEEPVAKEASREVETEEAKPESGTTDQSSAQGDQHEENLPKTESTGTEDVVEDKDVTNDQPEHQQETTRELPETTDSSEPAKEIAGDQSAKPESNNADQQPGDREVAHEEKAKSDTPEHPEGSAREIASETNAVAESNQEHQEDNDVKANTQNSDHPAEDNGENTTSDSAEHPVEAARGIPSETEDSAESKQESQEDNGPQVESHISDPQAEDKELAHEEEKDASDHPAHQQDSTRVVPSETTDSKEDPATEHSAAAPVDSERDASHDDQPTATQSQSAEDTSSAHEPLGVSAEEGTGHSDPASEGITKGGAAEEYLQMADADTEAHQDEDSGSANAAVDNKANEHPENPEGSAREIVDEPTQSASDEQATSHKDVDPTGSAETPDVANAEAVKADTESSDPAHVERESIEDSSPDKHEDTPSDAHEKAEAAPSETRDVANSEDVKESTESSVPAHGEEESAKEPSHSQHEDSPSDAHAEPKAADVLPEAGDETSKSADLEAGDGAAPNIASDPQSTKAIGEEDHDEHTSNEVDERADSQQPQADFESAAKSEVEPQAEAHEATHASTEAEPAKVGQTVVGSHDDSTSPVKDSEEQHPTEQSGEPQELEQADMSQNDDQTGQDQGESSLAPPTEHKDQEAQGSRSIEGGDKQKDPEHGSDDIHSRAVDDSAPSVDHDHLSVDQAAPSEPLDASQPSNPGEAQKENEEEVLEGSGNDLGPSRGLDVKDSDDHPAEESFDLSGNEPIPGTMTHGKDPEGADKNNSDVDTLSTEAGEKDAARDPDAESAVEQPNDAGVEHAGVEKAAGASEGLSNEDAHDVDTKAHDATDHGSEHQGDVQVHDIAASDKGEPEEQKVPTNPSSLDQEPSPTRGQEALEETVHGDSDKAVNDAHSSKAGHSVEFEQPAQSIENDKTHDDEPSEQQSVLEDSEKPAEHDTPTISVDEHKPLEDLHEQDSKPVEGPSDSSSRDVDQTGPDSAKAQPSGDAWEDRHATAEPSARRPSAIHTDNLHPDDDADQGLFAVPPTPRDEVDQQKPTSLQTASQPEAESGHEVHDASASLPTAPEDSFGAARGTESSHIPETGAEQKAAEPNEEEDRTSQPPWLAQNGQSEELPALQTGSGQRDIDAHGSDSAHSRDGSYHEDFHLSPVAYTPVDKKSRSVEAFEGQKEDEGDLAAGHVKDHNTNEHQDGAFGNAKADVSPTAPVEEAAGADASHRDASPQGEHHETADDHVNLAPEGVADQSPAMHSVEQLKESQREESPSRSVPQEQQSSSSETPYGQHSDEHDEFDNDEVVHSSHQPTSHASGVNYDGEGYGYSPSEEQHYDAGATAFPHGDQNAFSPGLTTTSQSEARSSFSGHDAATFSQSDDRTETESHTATPTTATGFGKDQQHDCADTPGQFHHALGNLPDESAHTVQGTDDLFDDDDDDDDSSEYGEAIVEPTEKLVYQANGSSENVALGGNHSSLSLGRNSMASQGSYGHRSAGSHSSFGSVRETTPLRFSEGSYLATSPSIVRADWAADHEDELRPHSSRATPQLQPSTTHDTPGISPFALRNTPAGSGLADEDTRGLAASRWSPRAARPHTPTSTTNQAAAESPQTPSSATRLRSNNPFRAQQTPERPDAEEVDPSMYMPRDVTNTPWHARNDSIPVSLHSQTTLSSTQDSPIHSSLPVDRHEPVIRDSWPTPAPGYQQYLSSWGGRPRAESSLSSNNGDYDPFKPDAHGNGNGNGNGNNVNKSSIYNPYQQRSRAESSVSAAPSAVSAASASPSRGSGLFQKMRSVFEQGGSGSPSEAPGLTRPVSGTYHAISPLRSPARPEHAGAQEDEGYSTRPGVSDLRGEASAALRPNVKKVIQLVDLRAESADDTHSERVVQVAEGRVSSQYTITSEVEPGSEFRLAWLMVEGWRAQLRKGGDIVEKARWEWKLEDIMAESRARRASIPDIVAGVPSSMKGSVKAGGGGGNSNKASRSQHRSTKSVHWRDRA